MKNVLSLVGGVFFLLGCNVDRGKKVDIELLNFETTDRSEIYFKNMRQSSYTVVEEVEAGIYLYTQKTWEKDSASLLIPTIVFNWRQDRAYVMLNWSAGWLEMEEVIVIVKSDGLPVQRITYSHGNMRDQLGFAANLYNALAEGATFTLEKEGEEIPLFDSEEKEDAFRVTLYDYLRLTGWF